MKKISKKTLNSSFWRWWYGNLTCFSHEHMQTFGYMWAMIPILKELYPTHEEQSEKLETYYAFFNTEPQIGCIVVGVTAGLEEARANGAEGIDDEMINGIRAGLMGPLAGIGDSLIVGTYIPILLGIAVGLAEGGSVIGPIFYIVVWNLTSTWFQKFVFDKGYSLGGSAVELLVGEKATAFRESVIVMGQVIVGAMAASWVNITTPLQIATNSEGKPVMLQDNLDGAFPKILTCLFVVFCWWLQAKKGMSPIKVLLLMALIAFVGSCIGILG
ncbi:MAG TPA: PTS fructose transporter subunit IID [Erysipelotrichaceae bacterium]|nr:PTS fructose transporter subunit IID [Erysipelotrichaceae bacterium]